MKQVCHRDLKLENTLLDGDPALHLKICDFGYSKVRVPLFLKISVVWVPCFIYFTVIGMRLASNFYLRNLIHHVIGSLRCFIHSQSQLWELLLILLQKYFWSKSMMERLEYSVYDLVVFLYNITFIICVEKFVSEFCIVFFFLSFLKLHTCNNVPAFSNLWL